MDSKPLDSIVVAQFGTGVAGAFCARLFADLGAIVIELRDANLSAEPRTEQAESSTEDDIERLLLDAGKSSVMIDPHEATGQRLVSDLLAAADVVIMCTGASDGRADGAGRIRTAAEVPDDAVLVEISDFGSEGPYSGYVGSEVVAGAIGGWLYGVGEPDREPLRPPGRHCRLITGLFAFVGAAAAVYRRRAGGPGRHLDVSAMEAVLWTQINITTTYDYSGHVPRRHGIRSPMNHPQGLYECADGLIGVNVLYYVEWDRFIELIDRPDLADDPRFATPVLRAEHSEALDEVIRTFVSGRNKRDLYDLAQKQKIPFALVNSPADLLTARQLVGRDFWRTVRDPAVGPVPMPSVPFLIDGARPAPHEPAPQPGQNNDDVRRWIESQSSHQQNTTSESPAPVAPSSDQPIRGLRVVDLTMAWAGPMAVRFLAELGADVVKIEGPQHMDRWRGGTYAQRGTDRYPGHDPGKRPWNRSSFFNTQNRGKRSLALDLKTDGGKQILRDLVARADVVVENFSAGAMGRLGLDYPALKEVKPDIIMVSMPALGRTGPEREYIAHGPTIEELAGTTYLQGYPGGPPLPSGALAWGDPVAGVYGGAALMTALLRKQQTGNGCHIDLSHLEAGVTMNADAVLRYALTGRESERIGNGDLRWSPQGVFPCRGEDRWIAISITDDACWRRLREAMGDPEWASVDELETVDGRFQHADLVSTELGRWCQDWEHRELMAYLQSFQIPAGAVLDARDLLTDPHLASRGFFVEVNHPETGKHRYPGLPYRVSGSAEPQSRPAPSFGEHNDEILADWLGLSDNETSRLRSAGVLATEPVPQGD